MRNKKTLKVASLMAVATACVALGAFAFTPKIANAESEDVFHELGASVRISSDKGIRFAFGLPVEKTGDGYEIGTLVIPKNALGDAELNHNDDPADAVDVDYQPIPCTKNWVPSEELGPIAKDGYKYYNAALTDIPQIEYNTVLVARSYYLKDGVYTYSDPVERSIGYVASAALNDGYNDTSKILTGIVAAGYGETALSVDMASDLITVDEEATLTASNEKGYLPIWSSSNESVATIDKTGKIDVKKGGETTITATIGNVSATKTVYVVGDGLYSDQIGMRIGGYQYHDKPAYFNMATGENGEMIITAQFSDSAAYYPMLMLRNMYSKAYYEKLIAEGYKKLTFSLAVGGDNASDVSDLYVFGKALPTFAKNASGAYQIVVDVQYIVTYYDNIYGIATTGGQAGQSGSLDKMLIAWKSPLTWSGNRNYVFTISNPEFRVPTLDMDFAADSKEIIAVAETTTLVAAANVNGDIVWSSSNNEVATVENGVVTGLKAGEATITATLGDLTASKTVYVVGNTLDTDSFAVIAGAWNQPTYITTTTGENDEMVITAQFKGDQWRWPAVVLRNLESKAYYEKLIAEGYTKFVFNLAIGGANAADVSDLYIFGQLLSAFPVEDGVYTIAVDVQNIVNNYDTIGILGTSVEAVPSKYHAQMLISWKCTASNASTTRNYVFTIANAAFMFTPTLDVNANDVEIAYGETATLIATTNWDESFVVWSSSDETIATVENGVVTVTGQNWGEVTITATIAGVSVDTIITVNAPTQLEVEFTAESKDIITVNGTTTLETTTDWNVERVVWSSSNNEVATVENGVVTGVKGGEVTITATLGELTASKTIYVVGDGLYSDQIGMRIGGYQYHDKPAYFNMATGENDEMIITAQFSDSAAYYPMLMLRNMYSKAYYQALVSNGYTKLAFNLAVEGDISDLYVFGKALNTFPENEGIYAIAIDVEHITTYYDNIYGIATTGGQAGQAGSLDKMFIAWKSPLTWSGNRNYVFTIANAAFMSTPTLDVNANDVEIAYGETATLIATTNWDESFVVWSSSDETIATVENGVVTVTGQNWGEVTITATIAGVSVDTIITVNAPTLDMEFTAESKDIITVNETTTLEATTDWNVERVVWSSSNNEVATVENGVVTGVKGGEVTITATLGELTASKTIYVVGDGLYSDQIGMRIGGYQYHDKPAYFNMATGENGEMIITAKFSDSAAYYPMLMLRNMYSKAYYEKLIAEGYKKLTFSLAVGGDNASNVSDLYVFGKALPTFAKNASGAYQIVVDVQYIVTYYDNIYGIATTGGQAGQSGSLDKMLIAWKSPLTWSGNRNYVFTISNTGFRKGVLFSDDFGFRDGGVNKTCDGMTVDTGANGEIIIDATFNATATYGSFLMFNKMDTITYLGGLKGKYASFTFELTVEGGAVNDLHTFGTAKAISTCNKVSGKDNTYVVEIRLDMAYFTDSGWKSNMNTFATSTGTVGSWDARSQMLLAWRYSGSSGFVNPDNHAPRNYKFTIANFELRESLLYTY